METVSDFIVNIPPAEEIDEIIPYKARKISIEVPVEENGEFEVYIDEIIGVAADLNNNRLWLEVSLCTLIYVVPINPSSKDHILKGNMIEADKCLAEVALTEERICLGWMLNSRELLVNLPIHKCKAWISDLENIIKKKELKLQRP